MTNWKRSILIECMIIIPFALVACQRGQFARTSELTVPIVAPTTTLGIATTIPTPTLTARGTATAPVNANVRVKLLQEQGGRVSWLGTKDLIAFDVGGKEGKSDVYTAHVDGSDKRCLTCDWNDVPQMQNGNSEWHPSGNYIVFQAQGPSLALPPGPVGSFMAGPGIGISNNIWAMNADGSKTWQITHVQSRSGTLHPQFSPDGKKILWSEIAQSGGELGGQWAMKLGDFSVVNGEPRVTNLQTLTPGNFGLFETHGFSPDNRRIIFSVVPQGEYYYDMEIYTYDLTTQQLVRLTENNEWDEHAHYSPDGKIIAWMSSTDIQVHSKSLAEMTRHPLKTDVWLMNADGSNKRRLTHLNDPSAPEGKDASRGVIVGDISWGPDSKSFVTKIQLGRTESIVLVEFDAQGNAVLLPGTTTSLPGIEAKPGAAYNDITYCTPDGVPQKMDVVYPTTFSGKPTPVAVYIQGGAWMQGDKDTGAGAEDIPGILARGYLVVSLNYRLAPQYKWPSQITDVKCAIRHLRANATIYKIDPNKIGLWGGSAGGHRVSMLGTTDESAGFDVSEYLDQSSRVQAVADMFGRRICRPC